MYVETFNAGVYPTKSGKTAIVNFYMTGIKLYDEPYENKAKIIGESKKIKWQELLPNNPNFDYDAAIKKFLEEN